MRPPLILAIGAALVGVAGAGAVALSAGYASAAPRAAISARAVTQMPTLEERVLDAINTLRRAHGLAQLRLDPRLAATAREHSLSMAEHGYFRHSSLGGSSFWSRVEGKYGRPIWRVGENLVWASPHLSASQAIAMWLKSPPHRRNLLAPLWREIGLGAVHADPAPGAYQGLPATILTADFGVRR
jgi:uncharacterized protein YkwD